MNEIAKSITGDDRIPTIPAVVARLLSVYADEAYELDDVVSVLKHAPGISARILRMANSPYFGFSRRIYSLNEATVLLGRAMVQGLALGTALLKPWNTRLPPEAVWSIWRDSYLVSIGCRALAVQNGAASDHSSPEELSVAGLLQDVGKIILLSRHPEAYLKLLEEGKEVAEQLEDERMLLGEDHTELGFEAMVQWRMPELFSAVAAGHHGEGVRACYAADLELVRLVNALVAGEDTEHLEHCVSPSALEATRVKLLEAHGAAEEFCKIIYPG